jgi:hypothetical protein
MTNLAGNSGCITENKVFDEKSVFFREFAHLSDVASPRFASEDPKMGISAKIYREVQCFQEFTANSLESRI